MKAQTVIPFVFAIASGFAVAQQNTPASFDSVDKNDDGVLSIPEAIAALPSLNIVDTNEDGIFNKAEAERLIAGLSLSPNNQGNGASPVREPEYRMIVQVLGYRAQAGTSAPN